MVQDAEAHADDDRRLRDVADARNSGESLIYSTEKSLREHGDKVDEATRSAIESAISELRSSLEGEDANEIRQRSQALSEASYKLAEAVYAASQPTDGGSANGGGTQSSEPEEEVVEDAEIVDDAEEARH
jgi:molecular chaperone DnaK